MAAQGLWGQSMANRKQIAGWSAILMSVSALPAMAAAPKEPPAAEAPAKDVEATKESERAPLRELQIFPKGPKGERPDLDDVILDWTADGHVRAARVASAKRAMLATEPGVTSLEPLKGLIKLEKLELLGVAVEDLAPLGGLPALQELQIQGCLKLKSLAPLAQMPALTRVRFHGATAAELGALAALSSLTRLELPSSTAGDAVFASSLKQIEHLDLAGSKALADISALANLKALRHLDLTGTAVKDLAPLAGLETLRVLRVSKKANLKAVLPLKAGGLRIEVK